MNQEEKRMLKESSDLLDQTWIDISQVLSAYHEKQFNVFIESLLRINEKVHGAGNIIKDVIFKDIVMSDAQKKSESGKLIVARIKLAERIIDLMEQEAPGNEELHYEALMLAFHASTNTAHYRDLFRSS